MRKPKVGEVIRRIAMSDYEFEEGATYEIIGESGYGKPKLRDKYGDITHLEEYEYSEFEIVEQDPGFIDVNLRNPIDETGYGKIEVIVDKLGLKTIVDLQEKHLKLTEASEIKKQIAELEKKLKAL